MAKLIQDNAVDMVQMTPSRMQLLLNHDKNLICLKNVKEIMIGGEPFPLSLLRTLQEKTTAKIYNMYGPTETTIWSTVSNLTHKDRIDIGRPIKNTDIYIVDENLSILPKGQAGEICIAGKGLAKGYVGRDDLTAEKFIRLPQKSDVKIYRTGDMGRYLPDGDLECLGRTDNQVKIRGHRIELEEIESYLNQFEGIKQSVVIALETSETDKILQAFYTSDGSISSKDVSNYLSMKLPSDTIPATFKRVKEFIQTLNGKIDRKRVFECIEVKSDATILDISVSDELNDVQKKAFEVIITNLSGKISDNVTLDMDFNSIGLDSITFIKTIVALEGEFDFEFDDEMLLIVKFPTIKTMIEYVESKAQ
jgi:acyl-coenzyme A synthetase/AMP-(fatty) acid ligase/acyl carrier protein